MYRILEENQEVRERRDQLRHPHYTAPELLATAPNQVWSWDITKLLETATYCAVSAVGNDSLSLAPPVRRDARGQATEFIS